MLKRVFLGLSTLTTIAMCAHNILDFGAVHDNSNTDIAYTNAKAMALAIEAALASTDDREVLVPENGIFYMMPFKLENAVNFTFTIDGLIYVSED